MAGLFPNSKSGCFFPGTAGQRGESTQHRTVRCLMPRAFYLYFLILTNRGQKYIAGRPLSADSSGLRAAEDEEAGNGGSVLGDFGVWPG